MPCKRLRRWPGFDATLCQRSTSLQRVRYFSWRSKAIVFYFSVLNHEKSIEGGRKKIFKKKNIETIFAKVNVGDQIKKT